MTQKKIISSLALTVGLALLHPMNHLHADQEPPRSLADMMTRSELVADGKVTEVTVVATEDNPHPNGRPIVRKNYRASFIVRKILKAPVDVQKDDQVYLEYWHTDDNRFRGDLSPKLKVGDEFRLFAENVKVGPKAVITAYLHTSNSVRP